MITDRTQADVDNAKLIRTNKVQKFITPTAEDLATLEKGMLTITTLNRIEDEQARLKGLLADMGYYNTNFVSKTWQYSDIFNGDEFQRIIDNTDMLRDAFFVLTTTPVTPSATYDFETFNALEQILVDLDIMINDVKSYYKECGNFECGVV